jgi:hypothetical protein
MLYSQLALVALLFVVTFCLNHPSDGLVTGNNASFMRRTNTLTASYRKERFVTSSLNRCRCRSSSLSMNLFDRFTRVAKSNLNNILKNLEDPEKIMNQAVEDMQVRNISYRLWFGVIIFTHIIIRNNLLSIFDFISPS